MSNGAMLAFLSPWLVAAACFLCALMPVILLWARRDGTFLPASVAFLYKGGVYVAIAAGWLGLGATLTITAIRLGVLMMCVGFLLSCILYVRANPKVRL